MGSYCLMDMEFQFAKKKKTVQEIDHSDGCPTMCH